jgi:hypothetical protein
MKALFLAFSLVTPATGALAAPCATDFKPFTAEYDLYRNGKRLGTTVVELSREDTGTWVYELDSKARRGIIGLVGAGYEESTRWLKSGDRLMPLTFRRKQHVAFSNRSYEAHFDWTAKRAWGRARDREWQVANLDGDTLDRLLVNLALVRDLRCGRQELIYKVLEKGDLDTWRFNRRGKTTVTTPHGEFQTVKIAKHHDNPQRESLTWHAPALDWIAVRIEHQDDVDEDRFSMVLRSLKK